MVRVPRGRRVPSRGVIHIANGVVATRSWRCARRRLGLPLWQGGRARAAILRDWVGAGDTQLIAGGAKLLLDHVRGVDEFVEWSKRGDIVRIGIG